MYPHNLTNENYFEDKDYMSVSEWKKFAKCEYDAVNGVFEPTDSMLVGSYVDSFVEGTLEQFKADHPEIISSRGESKGQLKAEFKKANEVCDIITSDKTLQNFLGGEKQTIMIGLINGVPWKIKMDSYIPNMLIADLKVMASITNGDNYSDFITKWGYDVQLAVYQEIVYQNTGQKLPCYIVALTKETPVNRAVFYIPQQMLDIALYKVENTAPDYYEVKLGNQDATRCEKCKTCISTMTDTPIINYGEII